jgi:hypothetical protein
MRPSTVLAAAVLLAARPGWAETDVRRAGDRVDVRATAAPVSEVLDRLARETGMKVTYDGAPPRARISVALSRVTPAQAVLSVLEGQGLNYVLRMDPTATRVDALLMVSGSGSGAGSPAAVGRVSGGRPIDREPDNAEGDEENTPTEAPARELPREAPDEAPPAAAPAPAPAFIPPIGPAVPLSLPAPGPPRPATGPPTTTPPGPNPQS